MAKLIKLSNEGWTVEDIQPENGTDFTARELHNAVEGYIELVELSDDEWLVANEDGMRDKLVNPIASELCFHLLGSRYSAIFGNVVICKKSEIV